MYNIFYILVNVIPNIVTVFTTYDTNISQKNRAENCSFKLNFLCMAFIELLRTEIYIRCMGQWFYVQWSGMQISGGPGSTSVDHTCWNPTDTVGTLKDKILVGT